MKATDLPELRKNVLHYLDSAEASTFWRSMADHGSFIGRDVGADSGSGDELRSHERTRWQMAELFFVTEDMTALAVTAGASLPSHMIRSDDLPSPFGVMFFARPIDTSETREHNRRTAITCCTWGHLNITDQSGSRTRGVWISLWADMRFTANQAVQAGRWTRAEADHLVRVRPPIGYDDEVYWLFDSMGDWQEGAMARCAATVRAAWLLMAQEVASVRKVQPRRSELRALRRKSLDLNRVRIVSLRHRKHESVGEHGEGREYTHRWLVRGHWRKQWYPSEQRHIPIWINAHVKGPEGAPLMSREIVNVWSR